MLKAKQVDRGDCMLLIKCLGADKVKAVANVYFPSMSFIKRHLDGSGYL